MIRKSGVLFFLATAVVGIALAGACGPPTPVRIPHDAGPDAAQACNFDSDCSYGFCANGVCAVCPETPCNPGYLCNPGTGSCEACTPSTCPSDGGSTGKDGGITPRDAGTSGDGGACTPASCGAKACINGQCVPCNTDGDCGRTGYICSASQCTPGCRSTTQCSGLGAGYWCNGNNQCQWGCLPQPNCAQFCCNLGSCDTTTHQCSGFTNADGGLNTGDGGVNIPDGGFTLGDGGSTTGLCFGGTPPSNGLLFIAWVVNCGCDLPASCNVCDPINGCAAQCAPLQGTCCIASGGIICTSGSDCCSGVCNNGTCQ